MARRILVVEDSPLQARRLQGLLVKHRLEVLVAANGREALACVHSERPDLVVTDVVMPEMDGFELCKALKSDPTTASIPVVIVTSLSRPEQIIGGLQHQCDQFLLKPFNERRLIQVVTKLLYRSESGEPTTPRKATIQVDGRSYSVDPGHEHILDLLVAILEDTAVEEPPHPDSSTTAEADQLAAALRYLVRRHSDPLLVVARDGHPLYANTRAADQFSCSVQALLAAEFRLLPGAFGEGPAALELGVGDEARRVDVLERLETVWDGRHAYLLRLRSAGTATAT